MGVNSRLLACVVLAMAHPTARADESLVSTAQSGTWAAIEHCESMTAKADVCLAFDRATGVAFRSDGATVQIRVLDRNWSLPAEVKGTLVISVSDYTQTLEIDDNTADTVNAETPDTVAADLFSRMDHASIMRVTVGKAKPINVSLAGSTRVTNAFRTCADIRGNAASPGSDPFQ